MAFTAADVKKLREMTNVGMMDCKKALSASDGDMDKAVEWLRERGLAAAAKKSGRIAAEGMVAAVVEGNVGAIVEVNAETDFASKSPVFVELVNDVAKVVVEQNPADMDALMACTYPGTDKTIADMIPEKVLVVGENLKVRRFARYDTGVTVAYNHMGGRIGVLVNMTVEGIDPAAVTVHAGRRHEPLLLRQVRRGSGHSGQGEGNPAGAGHERERQGCQAQAPEHH